MRRVRRDRDRDPFAQLGDELDRARKRLRFLEQPPLDELQQLAPERVGATGLLEQALEDARAVVERSADQRSLVGGAEAPAVAREQLLLRTRPAGLGVDEEAVAVEDDRGGRYWRRRQLPAKRSSVFVASRSSACTASSRCSGFVSSSFV